MVDAIATASDIYIIYLNMTALDELSCIAFSLESLGPNGIMNATRPFVQSTQTLCVCVVVCLRDRQ